MSSLVDITFRTLASRLQRGGTQVETIARPESAQYRWVFVVREEARPKDASVTVEVALLGKNVYKVGDTVKITVSELVGTTPTHQFVPQLGNSPSLERVESFVRTALAGKLAAPAAPTPPPPPAPVEICSINGAEPLPELPVEPPPPPPPPRPRKRDGGFKHPHKKSGPEPEQA